jgi:predicted HTH transcriptional regulator
MPKPVSDWEEEDVLALPPGENDGFERKGAKLLDLTIPGVKDGLVLNELAKQLSAFANMGGGQIIYGVTDVGTISNGDIARVIRGRKSSKEWLEDVIPTLTEYEITGFNVYEIRPKPSCSSIAPDKSLYVVDVPDSDRAPHQSTRDHLYYVRLAKQVSTCSPSPDRGHPQSSETSQN